MVQVKLIEQKQYDNNGVTAFLIFYLNGKEEGAGKLYSSRVWELPEDEKNICKYGLVVRWLCLLQKVS